MSECANIYCDREDDLQELHVNGYRNMYCSEHYDEVKELVENNV